MFNVGETVSDDKSTNWRRIKRRLKSKERIYYIFYIHLGNKLRYSFITLTFIANT